MKFYIPFLLVDIRLFLILWMMTLNGVFTFSQTSQSQSSDRSIHVLRISEPVEVDGILSENFWTRTVAQKGMHQNFPADDTLANNDTEVRLAYDDDNLYVAVISFAKGPNFVTTSLRRDYDFFGNDNITLLFDTFNDLTNALAFGINAYGVRREATVANAGQSPGDFDESWDNKWNGAVHRLNDRWIAELVIPFW